MTEIRKTDQYAEDWHKFLEMPGFDGEKDNDFDFAHLQAGFYVIKNGRVSARIACYLNPHHTYEGRQLGVIGNLACEESYSTFLTLMDRITDHYRKQKIQRIAGPMNGSTWYNYRFVSSSEGKPFFLDLSHPSFYHRFFKDYGFETLATYFSQKSTSLTHHWDKVESIYNSFIAKGVSIRSFEKENFKDEFQRLGSFCNLAFADNFLFSPIENEEFAKKMESSLPLIDPKYTLIAEYESEIVGFIFCYPDLLSKDRKTIVVKTIARDPSDKFKGLGSVLSSLVMKKAIDEGFEESIHALIIETNRSKHLSNKFKASYFRSYELLTLNIN